MVDTSSRVQPAPPGAGASPSLALLILKSQKESLRPGEGLREEGGTEPVI